jgi:hypothetical protein
MTRVKRSNSSCCWMGLNDRRVHMMTEIRGNRRQSLDWNERQKRWIASRPSVDRLLLLIHGAQQSDAYRCLTNRRLMINVVVVHDNVPSFPIPQFSVPSTVSSNSTTLQSESLQVLCNPF